MTRRPDTMLAADHIRQLTRPYTTSEWAGPDNNRHLHTVHHPPLLTQLRHATAGSTTLSDDDAGTSGIARSKPAAHLEALDTLERIDQQARDLCADLGLNPAKPLPDRLSAISGSIGDQPHPTVRSWWASARVVTRWDRPAYRPSGAPCPDCWDTDTLRVNLDDELAVCVACGQTWDRTGDPAHGSLDLLGQHVAWCTDHEVTKARHWLVDPDGFPVECVECLAFRQAWAEWRHRNDTPQPSGVLADGA